MADRVENRVKETLDDEDLKKGIIPNKKVFSEIMAACLKHSDRMWMLENAMDEAGSLGGNADLCSQVRCRELRFLLRGLSSPNLCGMYGKDIPRSRKVDKMKTRRKA